MSHDKSTLKFLCIKRKNRKDLKVVCIWPGSCKVSECFLIGGISLAQLPEKRMSPSVFLKSWEETFLLSNKTVMS